MLSWTIVAEDRRSIGRDEMLKIIVEIFAVWVLLGVFGVVVLYGLFKRCEHCSNSLYCDSEAENENRAGKTGDGE
jgi:hypothetical protein